MTRPDDLDTALAAQWAAILQRIDDAVLLLDAERTIRYLNPPARRLLGYDSAAAVGRRCRSTTNGVDCEHACPLTFALNSDLKTVEDFETVYRSSDDRAVPLTITVIPLRGDNGSFLGAVEILKRRDPDPGFLLAGSSPASRSLKSRIVRHARSGRHLILVGERSACLDVGRAAHRFAGMPEDLFRVWTGSWSGIKPWPPGTVYAAGDAIASLLDTRPPDQWRVVLGLRDGERRPDVGFDADVIVLPGLDELRDDIDLIIAAWLRQLDPTATVSPAALRSLGRLGCGRGFDVLGEALSSAVAIAGGHIEERHVVTDGYSCHLVDELLRADDPLNALEQRLLTEVLHRSGWRMQEAADRLGVSRVTLWRKLKDHGIERPECPDG